MSVMPPKKCELNFDENTGKGWNYHQMEKSQMNDREPRDQQIYWHLRFERMNATHDMMVDIVPNSPAQYCVFLHTLFTFNDEI